MISRAVNEKLKTNLIKVNKKKPQAFIKLINKIFKNQQIIDKKKRIIHEGEYVLIPLVQGEKNINK